MSTINNIRKYTNTNTKKNIVVGSEYPYEPNKWEDVENTHNCYAYTLNQYKDKKINYPQMGKFGIKHFDKYYNEDRDFTCSAYEHRVLRDNPLIYRVKDGEQCKKDYYKGHFVVAPNKDFHWYRQDDNGNFSHKPGQLYVRDFDVSKNKIKDPVLSNRSDFKRKKDIIDYSVVCNSFVDNLKT